MQRLPGVDAGFLYMETPTLHMHTLKIAFIDAASVPGGYRFERLAEELGTRLHLLPPFRRRLVPVPLQLHHPVWIEDPDFDLSAHIRRHDVPAPGGMREVERVIGEIASHPLDRRRPLWEIHVLEGMADGRVAVVTKLHHAVADGVAASALLANVMDAAVPSADLPPAQWAPDVVPGRRRLFVDALVAWGHLLVALPRLLWRTATRVTAVLRHRRQAEVRPPRPILDTPRVSFNGALSPRRSFATASLPLADFKVVKQAFSVTFNDVVLAVCGGALRSWMDAHGERPPAPLVAGVPVSTDDAADVARLGGNRVSSLFTSLATDLDDPVERLRRIHAVTGEAKVVQNTLGLDMLEDWVQYTPPAPFAGFMRAYSRLRGANLHRPPINLVVSNVPGPTEPVHVAGARITDVYSVGPILEGIGLNVTVWSYLDRMNFSAIACPDSLPDLPDLVGRFAPALAELVSAAQSATDAGPAAHSRVG